MTLLLLPIFLLLCAVCQNLFAAGHALSMTASQACVPLQRLLSTPLLLLVPPHPNPSSFPLQLAAQAKSTEAVPIKVQLIAPPLYVMTTSSLDKIAGIEALTAAIAACKAEIEAAGGQIFVKRAPTVTSSKDETDLQRMLEDLEAANAEVSGDDESSDGSGSDSESGSDGEVKDKDKKDKDGAARGGAGGPASPRKKGM